MSIYGGKKKIQNFLRCAYSFLYLMETRNNIERENINLLLDQIFLSVRARLKHDLA